MSDEGDETLYLQLKERREYLRPIRAALDGFVEATCRAAAGEFASLLLTMREDIDREMLAIGENMADADPRGEFMMKHRGKEVANVPSRR